jgi:cytochrome c biogenesis protein CcmG, thiol:disulfide interchange protein DsbE
MTSESEPPAEGTATPAEGTAPPAGTAASSEGTAPPTARPRGVRPPGVRLPGVRLPGVRLPGMGPGRRPSTPLIITVAAVVVLVAAIIAIDATTHRPAKAAAPPPAAPAFTLPSLADLSQQVSLGAYRGHPVIVNFFASWCGPCKKETPLLAHYYRASGGKVVIIGVDANDSATAARRFLAANGVAYPVGFEATPAVADAYGVAGIPQTFFLNGSHRIVKRVFGDVTMKDLNAGVALIDGGASQ